MVKICYFSKLILSFPRKRESILLEKVDPGSSFHFGRDDRLVSS